MPITNPTELVDEFKKSGEFDRLRRELLYQFRNSDQFASFMSRVEEIATQRLTSDNKVMTLPETSMVKELVQHLNRYPVVERAVTEMEESTLSDSAYQANVRGRLTAVLNEDRKGKQSESNQQAANGSGSAREPAGNAAQAPGVNGHKSGMPNGPTMSTSSDKMDTRADGNESDDSAMLESPVSEKGNKALLP